MHPSDKYIGLTYGRLTVIKRADTPLGVKGRAYYFLCLCSCGTEKLVAINNLASGAVKSCGCSRIKSNPRYKMPEYKIYKGMLARCYCETNTDFHHYGGRGISVCDEWRKSFDTFLADMGRRPDGHSIERDDVDGHYEPKNCRWIPTEHQSRNRRDTSIRIGSVFGRLTVKAFADLVTMPSCKMRNYLCLCACGNETYVLASSLRSGDTKSCGCLRKETTRSRGLLNKKKLAGRLLDGVEHNGYPEERT